MHICALLNKDGGTLKTIDVDQFARELQQGFEAQGHKIDIQIVAGDQLIDGLDKIAKSEECDVLLAGGGDGTISAAAQYCWQSDKTLGVIPAGTMNLFARSLGLPLDLNDATVALAQAKPTQVDVGTANDRLFLHQISVGMHPKIVKLRDQQQHQSRFQKIFGSLKAALTTFNQPPSYRIELELDGHAEQEKLSLIAVSNNKYGRGHMPYADLPQQGELGVYTARPLPTQDNLKLASDLILGTWDTNPDLVERSAQTVTLRFTDRKNTPDVTIDGELVTDQKEFEIKIHPKALSVLVPAPPHSSN
ncbi:diacylglycerol/lipid kinase family protein [Maritalea mediterranea]|uniref:Diacylglycerol kinase family lipid kinase n=1 Tax=Maritalea mediterranea TaxID=2909667 RepID=A0ABS9E8G7_9HYPH|nr:diacylglycerol kinase family protein [Maritalea mediterranea]MCF4099162.1 diacylglycerol kinase family lipid kinase [Maritalea mediterranea]